MRRPDPFALWNETVRQFPSAWSADRKKEIQKALKALHFEMVESGSGMPDDLCYLTGRYLDDYLYDVEICQRFARRNREKMGDGYLLELTGWTQGSQAS